MACDTVKNGTVTCPSIRRQNSQHSGCDMPHCQKQTYPRIGLRHAPGLDANIPHNRAQRWLTIGLTHALKRGGTKPYRRLECLGGSAIVVLMSTCIVCTVMRRRCLGSSATCAGYPLTVHRQVVQPHTAQWRYPHSVCPTLIVRRSSS